MQPGTKKILRFLQSWIINTLAVLVAVKVVHGIHFRDTGCLRRADPRCCWAFSTRSSARS